MRRRQQAEETFLAEIIAPRGLEGSMSAARGMLAALAGESLSLEIELTDSGPHWYVRANSVATLDRALSQLRVAYPQARVEYIGTDRPDRDPLARTESASSAVIELRATDTMLPLRTDWRDEHDPLSGILATKLTDGERVICRLMLAPVKDDVARRIRRRAERAGSARSREDYRQSGPSPVPLAALFAAGAAALQGWRWYSAGEWGALIVGAAGMLIGLPLMIAIAVRLFGRRESIAAALVDRKLSTPLFAAAFDVCAFGVQLDQQERLRLLVSQIAHAYAAYGDPAGGGLVLGSARPFNGGAPQLALHMSAAEAAALWHLPHAADAPAGIRRTTARTLPPAPGHAGRGARVGVAETAGTTIPVAQHSRLLHRNQLIVAKTRRGKSTLLRHMAAGIMEGAASDADGTALVVVDPHQDLAEAVLDAVPSTLAARTVYLDFANLERPVGLNLLDVHLFPDRDRTTEHVVTMLNRLWPANWGPRMEGALRASVSSLLEANQEVPRDKQFTLLDVAPFLTDSDLRERVLTQVQDPALQAWWRDNYDRAGRVLQQQTANPVTSKIGRFTVTEASRLVLGQARSTFDPRALLRDGGVLVVNTAVGALGEGAASLVGATLLNLLGLIVEEQVMVPAAQRRRVVSLVDESSTLGAVDYPRMLSELGKYGASFVLVTQSLSKLDAIDRNLAPTIFANSDGLTVFQVSAEDARKLVPELGSDIEVEDLVSLDDFTCYARWWDGHARPPAFTLRVDPPPASSFRQARVIAAESAARYGRPRAEVVAEITAALIERAPAPQERHRKSKEELATAAEQAAPESVATAATAATDHPIDAKPGRGKEQRGDKSGKASPK